MDKQFKTAFNFVRMLKDAIQEIALSKKNSIFFLSHSSGNPQGITTTDTSKPKDMIEAKSPPPTTDSPGGCQQHIVRLLMEADNLMCVLDNLTRGYRKHVPDDPNCWCNGCVNPRAVAWMGSFQSLRTELEANKGLSRILP